MDIVSTMSSVSTTFELLQQKHPIWILTAKLIKKYQTVRELKAYSSPPLSEDPSKTRSILSGSKKPNIKGILPPWWLNSLSR